MQAMPGIHNAVRALVTKDDHVLVQRKVYATGTERFTLPGGAPEPEETLEQALKRECLEEIGCNIVVQDLLHVADYYKRRDTDPPTYRQQVEFLFRCSVPETYHPQNGKKPDKHQVAVLWLPINQICQKTFIPWGFGQILNGTISSDNIYLGRID